MFLFKAILTALILMNSINAAVLNMRTASERRATQSCHSHDHFLFTSYSVRIGVPYISAKNCDDTYHALESATISIANWQCVESDGDIQLWFNCINCTGDDINNALESRYPSVDRFNCPPTGE